MISLITLMTNDSYRFFYSDGEEEFGMFGWLCAFIIRSTVKCTEAV